MIRWGGSNWGWNSALMPVLAPYEAPLFEAPLEEEDDDTSKPEADNRKPATKKRKANRDDEDDCNNEEEKAAKEQKELDSTLRFLRSTEGLVEATRELRQCMKTLRARDRQDPLLERLRRTVLLLSTAKERLRADTTISRKAAYLHKRTKRIRPSLIDEQDKKKDANNTEAEKERVGPPPPEVAPPEVAPPSPVPPPVVATEINAAAEPSLLQLAHSAEAMDPQPINGKFYSIKEAVHILKTKTTTTGTIRRWKKEGKLIAGLARVQALIMEQRDRDMLMKMNPKERTIVEKNTVEAWSDANAVSLHQGDAGGNITAVEVTIGDASATGRGDADLLQKSDDASEVNLSEQENMEEKSFIKEVSKSELSPEDEGAKSKRGGAKEESAEEILESANTSKSGLEHASKDDAAVADDDTDEESAKKPSEPTTMKGPGLELDPNESTVIAEINNRVARLSPPNDSTTEGSALKAVVAAEVVEAKPAAGQGPLDGIVPFDRLTNPMDKYGNEPAPRNGTHYDMFEAVYILKFKELSAPTIQKWMLTGKLKCSKTTIYTHMRKAKKSNVMPQRATESGGQKQPPKNEQQPKMALVQAATEKEEDIDPEPANGNYYDLFEAVTILKTKKKPRRTMSVWLKEGKMKASTSVLYKLLRKEKLTGVMPDKGYYGDKNDPPRRRKRKCQAPPRTPAEVDRIEDDPEPYNGKHYTLFEIVNILLPHKKNGQKTARWVRTNKILCSRATVCRAMKRAIEQNVMPRKGDFGNVTGNRSMVDMSKMKELVGLTTPREIKAKLSELQKQDLKERGLPMTRFKEPSVETVKNYRDLTTAYVEEQRQSEDAISNED